jgi:hypothetical protein
VRLCLLCNEMHYSTVRRPSPAPPTFSNPLRPLPLCPFAVNRKHPCGVSTGEDAIRGAAVGSEDPTPTVRPEGLTSFNYFVALLLCDQPDLLHQMKVPARHLPYPNP